eukprot:352342-Chlamydomonas_euryale.AAC.5
MSAALCTLTEPSSVATISRSALGPQYIWYGSVGYWCVCVTCAAHGEAAPAAAVTGPGTWGRLRRQPRRPAPAHGVGCVGSRGTGPCTWGRRRWQPR